VAAGNLADQTTGREGWVPDIQIRLLFIVTADHAALQGGASLMVRIRKLPGGMNH
jgi:hypothetical protein